MTALIRRGDPSDPGRPGSRGRGNGSDGDGGNGGRPGPTRHPRRSAGVVGRRRPLPSGRAVAGGFLIAAAATLVLLAWLAAGGTHGQRWVVARQPLAAGTRLEPNDLGTETMTLPRGATSAGAFQDPTALSGRTLAAPLQPGELIQQATLVPTGAQPALRPVAISLGVPDTADLSTGTRVDVLVTEGSGAHAATTVVMRGAEVLDVASGGSSLVDSTGGDQVTLGVRTLPEVEAVVHASQAGTLSVIVGEPSDGSGLGPTPTPSGHASSGHGPTVAPRPNAPTAPKPRVNGQPRANSQPGTTGQAR
jgi:Flp pilus assembly protein CpaB